MRPGHRLIELPAYISPIAVIFNLEGVDTLNLDAATIAGIFKGTITNWNDAAIVALNADADLPDQAITAVHRSDDSGTTKNFTDYLHATAPEVWTTEADGVWPFEGGEAAPGHLRRGRRGHQRHRHHRLRRRLARRRPRTVAIKVGDEFVAYSAEAAAAVVDASPVVEGRSDGDLAIELDRTTTEAGDYPLVLVSYLIACTEYADADSADLVKAYFSYIASEEGQEAAADAAGAAPLSVGHSLRRPTRRSNSSSNTAP